MVDDLFQDLISSHPEMTGGPYTWKAFQDGPLGNSIKKALDSAYSRGYQVANEENKPKTQHKK